MRKGGEGQRVYESKNKGRERSRGRSQRQRTDGELSAAGCECARARVCMCTHTMHTCTCCMYVECISCPCFLVCIHACVCVCPLSCVCVELFFPDGTGKQTLQGWHDYPVHSWHCQPPCSPLCTGARVPAASRLSSLTDWRAVDQLTHSAVKVSPSLYDPKGAPLSPQMHMKPPADDRTSQSVTQHQIACHTLSIDTLLSCTQLHCDCILLVLLFQQELSCLNFFVKSLNSDVS